MSGRDDGLHMLAPGGLFALAVAVRALPWRSVLAPDGVHLAGHDAWYHLRRISWSIANPPHVLEFDPFLHFPAGAKPIWSPAFDGVLAAILGAWVAPGESDALERAAVWVPPVLGGLGVLVLYLCARRHFGGSVAALAGLVLALLPAHFWYSRLGYVDHHVAVALSATLGLAAALSVVRAAEPDASSGPLATSAFGATLAAMFLVWPGALLHAGLFEVALIGHAITRANRKLAAAAAWRFALAHALAFALVTPFCVGNEWPQWGAFTPLVLSRFQPWWLGALALGGGLSGLLWARTAAGIRSPARAAQSVGLAAGILCASALIWPGLRTGVADAVGWLLRDESFQARVAESQPLFFAAGAFEPGAAIARLSLFVLLVPVAVPWIWLRVAGRAEAERVRLVLVWSVGLFIATLLQRRFFHSFAVAEALLIGFCWALLERWLIDRLGSARRTAIRAGLGVALALLLLPSLASYRGFLARPAPGEPLAVSPETMERRVTESLAIWLRGNTPGVSGWLERDGAPEYGVLAPWQAGHAIQYLGRRPTVVDNFGDDLGPGNFELAERYFASSEPEALEILDALRVRYVVTGPGSLTGAAPGAASMFRALLVRDGAALPSTQPGVSDAPALERHRLVWESAPLAPRDRNAASVYKVFAVVRGARIEGRATPGVQIDLDLSLRTSRGRQTGYRATTTSDSTGRFAFRVPHAAPGGTQAVRAPEPYLLRCGDVSSKVRVDESAVEQGATVRVPPVCP